MTVIVLTAVVLSMVAMVTAGPPCPTTDHFDICMKTENATRDDLQGLYKKDFALITPTGMCAMACVLEKSDVIVNGTFSSSRIMETYKPCLPSNATYISSLEKALENALEKCEKDVGSGNERCEAASKVVQCYFKYNNEVMTTMRSH